mgnify:CR=1 FL=1
MRQTTRRRFRFTLKQFLLVVVPLLSIVLAVGAYHLHWIRQRHAWCDGNHPSGYAVVGSDSGSAPGLLWLFGERGYDRLRVIFSNRADEAHLSPEQRTVVETIRRLYPEARVEVMPPYTGVPI